MNPTPSTAAPCAGVLHLASPVSHFARAVTAFCFAAFLWSQTPPAVPIPEGEAFNLWFD